MMPENFYFKQALKNKKNQLKIIKLYVLEIISKGKSFSFSSNFLSYLNCDLFFDYSLVESNLCFYSFSNLNYFKVFL